MTEHLKPSRPAAWWAILITGLVLLAALSHTGAVRAQDLPPRPTVIPTAEPQQRVTPVPDGRITGTVIDQTSGAPVPGVVVRVGDTLVASDANGNYDRSNLAAGTYRVMLELASGQGEAAQGPLEVQLAAHATVVQHLAFRSPVAAAPTPTAIPELPAALPATGSTSDSMGMLLILGLVLAGAGMALRHTQIRQN